MPDKPPAKHAGFIKLHRSILDHAIWRTTTPAQKTVMFTIFMMFYHSPARFTWRGQAYTVLPGQIITSASRIIKECGPGISRETVRSTIRKLKANQLISVYPTNHGMLITYTNWALEQFDNSNPTNQNGFTQPANPPNPTSPINKNSLEREDIGNNNISMVDEKTNPFPYIQDEKLLVAFKEYADYMESINAGMSPLQAKKKYQRLINLASNVDDQIKIIDQAIESGGRHLYPIQPAFTPTSRGRSPIGNFQQRDWDLFKDIFEKVEVPEND